MKKKLLVGILVAGILLMIGLYLSHNYNLYRLLRQDIEFEIEIGLNSMEFLDKALAIGYDDKKLAAFFASEEMKNFINKQYKLLEMLANNREEIEVKMRHINKEYVTVDPHLMETVAMSHDTLRFIEFLANPKDSISYVMYEDGIKTPPKDLDIINYIGDEKFRVAEGMITFYENWSKALLGLQELLKELPETVEIMKYSYEKDSWIQHIGKKFYYSGYESF